MRDGIIQIYYGEGHGKSTAAIGNAIHAASLGKKVIIIQFLKGRNSSEIQFLSRLEPEIKCFNFSKYENSYESLDEEQKQEEIFSLKNGFNYSRKVLSSSCCDMVILDELLGLEDTGVVTFEEVQNLLNMKPEETTVVITGRVLDDKVRLIADEIYNIEPEKL